MGIESYSCCAQLLVIPIANLRPAYGRARKGMLVYQVPAHTAEKL
jgi:hypothetical protein